jgi:uncharacterized protein (DUF302 family)
MPTMVARVTRTVGPEVSDVAYGRTVVIDGTVEEALPRVKEALKEQGFGVLTEIDVKATMKDKLDADVDPYVILGACNPTLAHRALTAEPDIGLLLPCNVIVRTHEGRVVVSAVDPELMSEVTDHPELPAIAEEATARLDAALEKVAATG